MLAVMEEFVPLFAKAEWDPTEAPEAKKEKDSTDNVCHVAEVNFDLCHCLFFAFWTFSFKRLKLSGHIR